MRMFRDDSGQALILSAFCLSAVMSVLALAVDVGNIRYRQIQLQTAADSAAVAAGLELGNCSDTICANMQTAAEKSLIESGITNATVTPTVNQCSITKSSGLAMAVNVGPCVLGSADPNKGNAHMAEVVLTQPQSTFFGRLFGMSTMNLVARAEAGDAYINNAPSGSNCIWAGSITFNSSNGNFNLTNCGIYDNGNLTTNNGDSVTATGFQYYGSWSPNNCNSSCTWNLGNSQTQPAHVSTAVSDPLAGTAAPSQPATQDANNCSISNQDCWGKAVTAGKAVAIPPGYYGGGINANSGVMLNFSPGLYYFNGSLNINSGATLECTTCTMGGAGVTLYFTGGSFQPNSGATITLNAPATGYTSNGDVANMLVWESSSNSNSMTMDASTSVTLNGIIYLPDAQLILNSGSGTTINGSATSTAVDVQSLMVDSGVTFDLNGSQSLLGGGTTASSTLSTKFSLAE